MSTHTYRFTVWDAKRKADAALRCCPRCGFDLTQHVGVLLATPDHDEDGEEELGVEGTRLDRRGFIMDTPDGIVAAGGFYFADCAGCGERLDEMDGVDYLVDGRLQCG